MAFHGLTFPNQNVSSLDDRGFYRSFKGDGIIQGCEMSFTNDSITIHAGWLIACGGIVQIDGATTINFDEIPTSGYGRVMLQIDTSQVSTAEDFAQLSYLVDYSASIDGFTAPVQEDINLGTGTIYQIVLAIVQISGGNITAITSLVRPSNLITSPNIIIESDASIGVNPSARFFYDGVAVGQVYSEAGTDIRIINNGQGAGKGLYLEPNYVTLWADEQPIILRPNGGFNTLNQIEFTASGQQLGGHPKTSLMTATSITCQADRDTDIQTVNGLDSNGVYIVTAGASFAPSASTGTQFRFALTSGNDAYTQSVYTASTASHMVSVGGLFSGTSWVTLRAHPYSGAVSCNATYRKICLVRIN